MYVLVIIFIFLLTLPLYIVLGIVLFITSGPPIFFRQKRIGKNGKSFVMYKFRTMEIGAEKRQQILQKQNEADGPVFKIYNDPRFTPIGKFLSHTGLDELPQLWNVLIGDMALVGPRPLPVSEARKLTRWQRKRETVKPGIISPWILEGYHNKPFHEWMKSDIRYVKKKSWQYDLQLMGAMIPFFFTLCMRACGLGRE